MIQNADSKFFAFRMSDIVLVICEVSDHFIHSIDADCGKMIFECALFQNIIEDMILYRDASDQKIMDFYTELGEILCDRDFRILYLETENIAGNLGVIRKERSDDKGNELWFPLMLEYFDNSPYAVKRGLSGEQELINHFTHRQELELRICREIFPDKVTVLRSKNYTDKDL